MMRPFDSGFSPQSPNKNEIQAQHTSVREVENNNPTTVKCILIGDKQVGKTSLVVSYTSNDYPAEYRPSALDTFCGESNCFIVMIRWFYHFLSFYYHVVLWSLEPRAAILLRGVS